jgi:ABC-2 type transport system permease protein
MNTLSIALKEIKQDFRDTRTLLFMMAFPIVLMLILGLALGNAFESSTTIDGIHVLVKDSSSGMLSRSFETFEQGAGKSGIGFEAIRSGQDGTEEVAQQHYDAYVELTDSGIRMFSSDISPVESNIVQGMLSAFTDKYNAARAVAGSDPQQAGIIFAGSGSADYIKETSIAADRKPGSTDYYALAMTVMIGMYGAMSAGNLIRSEILQGTDMRLVASPARKGEIFAGKVLGSIVINMLCILVLIVFSKLAFGAYWGSHPGYVLAVLLTEVIMAVSFGLAVSYLLNGTASRGVLMLIVQVASFIGGAYFPLDDIEGSAMSHVVNLSPIRWANHALTEIIYGGNTAAAWPAIGLNLVLAAVMLVTAASIMNRREGL